MILFFPVFKFLVVFVHGIFLNNLMFYIEHALCFKLGEIPIKLFLFGEKCGPVHSPESRSESQEAVIRTSSPFPWDHHQGAGVGCEVGG